MIVDMWYTLELTNTMYTPIAANHMIEMDITKQQTNSSEDCSSLWHKSMNIIIHKAFLINSNDTRVDSFMFLFLFNTSYPCFDSTTS